MNSQRQWYVKTFILVWVKAGEPFPTTYWKPARFHPRVSLISGEAGCQTSSVQFPFLVVCQGRKHAHSPSAEGPSNSGGWQTEWTPVLPLVQVQLAVFIFMKHCFHLEDHNCSNVSFHRYFWMQMQWVCHFQEKNWWYFYQWYKSSENFLKTHNQNNEFWCFWVLRSFCIYLFCILLFSIYFVW